jgi:hypothetical protein
MENWSAVCGQASTFLGLSVLIEYTLNQQKVTLGSRPLF